MAVHRPLVFDNSRTKRLPDGDVIEGAGSFFDAQNAEGVAINIGEPVYISGVDQVKRAIANDDSTSLVAGLVQDTTIASGSTGRIATDGWELEATTGEWDALTGDAGGLVAGARYFLSSISAGRLTTTPPDDTAGEFVAPVGRALNTTKMLIVLETRVKL